MKDPLIKTTALNFSKAQKIPADDSPVLGKIMNWELCGKTTGLGIVRVLPWISSRLLYQSAIWSHAGLQ